MKDEGQQRVLVDDIRNHARLIALQVRKGRDAFFDPTDPAVRDSVEHRLELSAEAAGKLPQAFKDANPRIPWSDLGELRGTFAHPDEEGTPSSVNHDRTWGFAIHDIPSIDRRLERPRFVRSK